MSDYTKTVDFAAKDSLPSGNSGKIIKGTEFETEFDNIATAIATKADLAGPTFTGILTFASLKGATGATVTTILDEDDMATNSATALATQQSIKAYVDAQQDTVDTLAEILALGNATGGTNIAFGDNDKAIFGAESDLQIYHDGLNSYITDSGTGNLNILANEFALYEGNGTDLMIGATPNGAVTLSHNAQTKLATTATGIDVTGTATMDGLTVDGEALLQSSTGSHYLKFYRNDSTINAGNALGQIWFGGSDEGDFDEAASIKASAFSAWTSTSSPTQLDFYTTANTTTTPLKRATIADNGDISFYEDTGTTPKLVWDASAESLGIGISSPLGQLHINTETAEATKVYVDGEANQPKSIEIRHYDTSEGSGAGRNLFYLKTPASDRLDIGNFTDGSSETQLMTFLESGNVGIGTTGPLNSLHIQDSALNKMLITNDDYVNGTTGTSFDVSFGATSGNTYSEIRHLINGRSAWGDFVLARGGGNVGIGTSSPSSALEVVGGASLGSGFTQSRSGHPTFGITNGGTDSVYFSLAPDGGSHQTFMQVRDDDTDVSSVAFSTSGSEAMRIDSSQNVLVGTTSSSSNTAGIKLSSAGTASFVRSGVQPVYVNRLTNEGDLAVFAKDGTTVGSIGVDSTRPYIASSSLGLKIAGSEIHATSATGVSTDATYNLGSSLFRWKDLYLSGGAYLGGTGAANKLDDYEEGTWTPVYAPTSGAFTTMTMSTPDCFYTKVGRMVTVSGIIRTTDVDVTGASGSVIISGLPFAVASWSAISLGRVQGFAGDMPDSGYGGGDATNINLYYRSTSNGATTALNVTDMQDGTVSNANYIFLEYTYQTL